MSRLLRHISVENASGHHDSRTGCTCSGRYWATEVNIMCSKMQMKITLRTLLNDTTSKRIICGLSITPSDYIYQSYVDICDFLNTEYRFTFLSWSLSSFTDEYISFMIYDTLNSFSFLILTTVIDLPLISYLWPEIDDGGAWQCILAAAGGLTWHFALEWKPLDGAGINVILGVDLKGTNMTEHRIFHLVNVSMKHCQRAFEQPLRAVNVAVDSEPISFVFIC